ncbi:hypothetical protein NIES2104_47390 [Leptolyngbya sp. NIES-2104]|nr:hypothetical protein NIES2104_47390 [Leptolyngbya sp. NIES-2104]
MVSSHPRTVSQTLLCLNTTAGSRKSVILEKTLPLNFPTDDRAI